MSRDAPHRAFFVRSQRNLLRLETMITLDHPVGQGVARSQNDTGPYRLVAEAFDTTHNIILLYPMKALNRVSIILPGGGT